MVSIFNSPSSIIHVLDSLWLLHRAVFLSNKPYLSTLNLSSSLTHFVCSTLFNAVLRAHPSLTSPISSLPNSIINFFLDASTHIYKRVCPSVGRSVGWSVRPVFFFTELHSKSIDNTIPSLMRTINTAQHTTTTTLLPLCYPGRIVVPTGTCFFKEPCL